MVLRGVDDKLTENLEVPPSTAPGQAQLAALITILDQAKQSYAVLLEKAKAAGETSLGHIQGGLGAAAAAPILLQVMPLPPLTPPTAPTLELFLIYLVPHPNPSARGGLLFLAEAHRTFHVGTAWRRSRLLHVSDGARVYILHCWIGKSLASFRYGVLLSVVGTARGKAPSPLRPLSLPCVI